VLTDLDWIVSDCTTNSELIHNIKGEFWSLNGDFANRSNKVATVDGERVEPPKAGEKPVFTQDNLYSEFIGEKCLIMFHDDTEPKWHEIVYCGIAGDYPLFVICSDGERKWADSIDFSIKPIDNRTDEEKAIEDIQKYNTFTTVDFVDAIKSGKIHGVKWVG
jgi:hypothetical protein